MKIRNIILTLVLSVLAVLPTVVYAKDPVKVYIFEAGGCPYCEAQISYLEGLDGYGTKFEVVRKELYVDHIDWLEGADYELGKKVAEAFNKAGFEDASYQGTPFVVVSDIYAVSAYNDQLESVINEAYEKGDRDAVTCIENDGKNCISNPAQNKLYVYITLGVIITFVITALGISKAKAN